MDKRIFFAFPLDEALQNKIVSWEKESKDRIAFPVRWVAPHDLHVTLIPPWQISEHQVDFLKGLLLPTLSRTLSFEVEFTAIEFGPTVQTPRVIWARGEAPQAMQELKNEMDRILLHADVDFHPDHRPLLMHVTLAKLRQEDFSLLRGQTLHESIKFFGVLSSVVIMQSILGFEGSEYNTLHHYILKEK